MHKRMSPHWDFDHMGEAINLMANFKDSQYTAYNKLFPFQLCNK